MSLLKSTLDSPTATMPFTVRLEPYLIESICELSRLIRDNGSQNNDISGLLFGKSEDGTRTVEALKTFVDMGTHSELARRQRWETAYRSTLEDAKKDPELSVLEAVGWFSFRTGSGLLSSDVIFHNQHFRKPEDLALVIWREGPSQITNEVYSRSGADPMTSDDYRWCSVRLSADIRHMREPVELQMRAKMGDDAYLNAYESGEHPSVLEALRRKAEAATERLISIFSRRKDENYPTEPLSDYIGDGHATNLAGLNFEGAPGPQSPQAFFNPYAATALGRNRPAQGETGMPPAGGDAHAPVNSPPWPGSGAAFATAPARSPEARAPELRPDVRVTESRLPPMLPPPTQALDFANIGHSPRTGRAAQKEISGLPMVLRPTVVEKAFPWTWAAGTFIVCSGLVFAFLAMGGLQSDGGRIGQIFQSVFPSGDLNLKVRTEDDRLRLSWNQRNHAVASASDGTLQIFDGQQHREIHLDGGQVTDGSVLYRPLTSDVTFKLEVRGDQGTTSGSVRVLDGLGGRQAVLDVSSPAQTASARPGFTDPFQPSVGGTAGRDGAPKLMRDGSDQRTEQTNASTAPPITEAPYVPVLNGTPLTGTPSNNGPRRPVASKPRSTRYETPQTIQPLAASGGGPTINGWDTSPASLSNQRTLSVKTAPVATGYVPPRPLMQVMPNTRAIPNGTLQGRTRVEVQVDVDQSGHVSATHLVTTGVNEKISAAALSAARQWTFDPASNNGQHVVSEHTIVYEFQPQRR